MLLIINPVAGKKKINRYVGEIVNLFNRAGFVVIVHITAAAGDANRQIQIHAKDLDLVVCCGGDGTFNEVASAVLESGQDIPIGYIPAGSTNDFAGSLGLSPDPLEAAENILKGKATYLDMGLFGDSKFTYIASFGAFTKASYNTPQSIKNALGHTAYVLEGLTELSQIRKIPVKMELDGQTLEDNFLFGAICNSTSVAGLLKLDADSVDMQDGLFEVLLIREPKDPMEVPACIHAITTQTYKSPMITFRSAKEIVVTTEEDMVWSLDGERREGGKQVLIRNLQKAIRVVI